MLGSSRQAGDFADIFESSVNLDNQHIQQGYNEGFKDRVELGKVEGIYGALKNNFEMGGIGFLQGCINIWKVAIEVKSTVLYARVQNNLKSLLEFVDSYPLLDSKITK